MSKINKHKVLFCENLSTLTEKLKALLDTKGYQAEYVNNGKGCRRLFYNFEYTALVVNIDVQAHSSIEVLKS